MSSMPNKTIGQKMDEVLEPFLADRVRLRGELKDQKNRRLEIENQIKETERDLQVVDQAMIKAIRDAARQEPLLSAAFGLRSADGQPHPITAIPVARPVEANPLLNPVAAAKE